MTGLRRHNTSAGVQPKSTQVGFAGVTGISRPVNNEEHWTLYYFEAHAATCKTCLDPLQVSKAGKKLCDKGHELAIDVAELLFRGKDGEIYSHIKDEGKEVRVELPHGYDQTVSLLKAIQRASRKGDAFFQRRKNYDRNYLVGPRKPADQRKEDIKPSPKSHYDTIIVQPSSTPRPRRPELDSQRNVSKDSAKRGSLYGLDMGELEKAEKRERQLRNDLNPQRDILNSGAKRESLYSLDMGELEKAEKRERKLRYNLEVRYPSVRPLQQLRSSKTGTASSSLDHSDSKKRPGLTASFSPKNIDFNTKISPSSVDNSGSKEEPDDEDYSEDESDTDEYSDEEPEGLTSPGPPTDLFNFGNSLAVKDKSNDENTTSAVTNVEPPNPAMPCGACLRNLAWCDEKKPQCSKCDASGIKCFYPPATFSGSSGTKSELPLAALSVAQLRTFNPVLPRSDNENFLRFLPEPSSIRAAPSLFPSSGNGKGKMSDLGDHQPELLIDNDSDDLSSTSSICAHQDSTRVPLIPQTTNFDLLNPNSSHPSRFHKQDGVYHGPDDLVQSIDWSHGEEMSEQESIFSLGQSSKTSMTSIMSSGIGATAVDQFVCLLLENELLKSLCKHAIEMEAIGPERFERNFRRLLKTYGSDLRREVKTMNNQQRAAANLVARQARYVAAKVRQSCDAKFLDKKLEIPKDKEDKRRQIAEFIVTLGRTPKSRRFDGIDPDSSGSSDDDIPSDGEGYEPLWHLSVVVEFLTTGAPFETLCKNLSNFIQPTWGNQLERFIGNVSKNILKYGMIEKDFEQLKRFVGNITDVDVHSILVHEDLQQSFMETFQCWMEKQTRTSWDWWPLKQPRHRVKSGFQYLSFRCNCGERRWEQIPAAVVSRLTRILLKAQERVNNPIHSSCDQQSSGAMDNAPPPQQQAAPADCSASALSQGKHAVPQLNGENTRQDRYKSATIPDTSNPISNGQVASIDPRLVFLTVNNNEHHHLAQIKAHILHDDSFFAKLKHEYIEKRGRLRIIFSIWRYAGCEFRKVEKILPRRIVPFPQVELPESTNPEYQFRLQPTDAVPPIGRHEFKMRYYECLTGGQSHWHWGRECRKQCRKRKDALEKIPKRDREVVEDGDEREIFWGLLAMEEIQFVRVLLYHILCLIGPFLFWILWMRMGHGGDFQDASVPITVALAFLGVLSSSWMVLGNR